MIANFKFKTKFKKILLKVKKSSIFVKHAYSRDDANLYLCCHLKHGYCKSKCYNLHHICSRNCTNKLQNFPLD